MERWSTRDDKLEPPLKLNPHSQISTVGIQQLCKDPQHHWKGASPAPKLFLPTDIPSKWSRANLQFVQIPPIVSAETQRSSGRAPEAP